MDEQELQQSFNDYIEPAPIPFSFHSPGWYALGVLILLLICTALFFIVRNYRRNRYRKQALVFLSQLEIQNTANQNYQPLAYQTAILIKRIAMAKYGRSHTAGLSGQSWLQWFNSTVRKKPNLKFDDADLRLVSDEIYADKTLSADRVNPFIEKAKNWIRYHHAI